MQEKINKIFDFLVSKNMNILDYIGALLTLLWALKCYIGQEEYLLYLVVGIVALLFAILRPTKYLIEKIRLPKPQSQKGK